MYSLFTLALSSLFFALILTPLVRNLFRRFGVVDRPDAGRKTHAVAVPRVGGIAIVLAYLGAFGVVLLLNLSGGLHLRSGFPVALRLLPAAAIVFGIGLLDDLVGLKPWHKLAGQFAASWLAIWAGVQILGVAGIALPPWLNLPLTLLWLIGCTNAFNLIDGMDGLAAGVGLFATATMLIAAITQGDIDLAYATMPLAGALLGFLRYNFNPASIFLGDCGSLLIGFLLGCYGVMWTQKSATLLGMTAPLMALSLPLLDTSIAIVRRFLRGQPIFAGDNGHIHHRLLARGLAPRHVVLLLYGVCGLAAAFSLLQNMFNKRLGGLVVVCFCAAAWLGIQRLDYAEFGAARRTLFGGAFRRRLGAHISLRAFEESFAVARTLEEGWLAIVQACRDLGFTNVRLVLGARVFQEYLNGADSAPASPASGSACPAWTMRVPLGGGGEIVLTRAFDSGDDTGALAPFAESLRRLCDSRLAELAPAAMAAHS